MVIKGFVRRFLVPLVLGLAGLAQGAEPAAPAPPKRIALVIGNAAYPGVAALKNPANDARDMAAKLRKLSFQVSLRTDVNQKDMLRALTDFGDRVQPGSEALFFYAGHGMQVHGRNYLIPIDAEIRSEGSVSSESVDVDQLLDKLAPARLSIVILDACRNNPFERRFRGGGQGLAQINAPTGTLIAYATAPGKVAADGEGNNGLYTAELLTAMDAPGSKIEDIFKRVRANVVRKSQEAQTPWESSSLTGDFFFTAPDPASASVTAPQAATPPDPATMELAYWDGVKDSRDIDAFKAYLDQYPAGRFAALARIRLRELSQPPAATPRATPQRSSVTDFLEGMWEYQMADNLAQVAIYWNPTEEQYQAILMRHGEVSRWVGFVIGEVVWKAKLTADAKKLRETQLMRTGANGVSLSQQWLEGELNLDRSTVDELVTSFAKLRRVGVVAGAGQANQATTGGPSPASPAVAAAGRGLAGTWVGNDGAWYKLSQDGNRISLRTDSHPVFEEEVRSTYTLVGNVPITSPVQAEFQLQLNNQRLEGSWRRAAVPAEKCLVPPDTAQVEGEWRPQQGMLLLRHDRTSFKASTQMALLGNDSCSGVVALGRKSVDELIYGPLGRGGLGVDLEGLTSWWEGGMSAIQFGWQGRLRLGVRDGSPAHQAGLRNKDEVLAIDGIPVKTLNPGEVVARLYGEPGSSVVLELSRKGSAATVTLTVQRVALP